jgi:CheY-like chemotaxis protein
MIQIIEDDLVTCHIITALLTRMHRTYCVAQTGAEAIAQFTTRPIDLVILDMMLPDMHGLTVLEYKHALPYLRDIPVLCCTSQADIDTVETAMGYGAVDFVRKPLAVGQFADRVARALERAPTRWESWRDMSRRLRFHVSTMGPMLRIAQTVLRELDATLELAQRGNAALPELNAVVARARGAALNVGALRCAQLIDRLWHSEGTPDELAHLRAVLVIELAAFDEAIARHEVPVEPSGTTTV